MRAKKTEAFLRGKRWGDEKVRDCSLKVFMCLAASVPNNKPLWPAEEGKVSCPQEPHFHAAESYDWERCKALVLKGILSWAVLCFTIRGHLGVTPLKSSSHVVEIPGCNLERGLYESRMRKGFALWTRSFNFRV
jgi:hypothetical protein